MKQKADGVEVDIRLTSDNRVICHHDKNTKRTTGEDKIVAETTFKELKTLDCGSWFGKSWLRHRIPELKEVFSCLKNQEIFIEVKTKEEIIPYLIKDMENYSNKCITVISFYPEVIRGIKEIKQDIKCNWLIAFDYKDISDEDILSCAKDIGADGIGAQNHQRLNATLVSKFKDNNLSTHVWTVDDVKSASEYLKIGIDSITTNRPLYLRNELENLQ